MTGMVLGKLGQLVIPGGMLLEVSLKMEDG